MNTEQLHILSDKFAPSGFETRVTDYWKECISPFVDEVKELCLGNVVAIKHGTGDKTLMLVAHADEIGLMVKYIDDRGFIYFDEIGGVDTRLLPGRKVRIYTSDGTVDGVIGTQPMHFLRGEEKKKDIEPSDLWIDILAASKEEALGKVSIGDVAMVVSEPTTNGTLFAGKAMDNRSSLFLLLETAKELKDIPTAYTIYLVATSQEEIGTRGAQTAAYALHPNQSIVFDVTHATDYPNVSPAKHGDIKLGNGPVIAIGPNITPSISHTLMAIADGNSIKYQLEAQPRQTGTDARTVQLAREGIDTALVSIPCRYMHTPVETIDTADIESAVKLITKYIQSIS